MAASAGESQTMSLVNETSAVDDTPSANGLPWFPRRLRGVLLAFAFWTTLGIGLAAVARLVMPGTTWDSAFRTVLPQCVAWALTTTIIFAVDLRLLRITFGRRIVLLILLAFALLPIQVGVVEATRGLFGSTWPAASFWESLLRQSFSAFAAYAIAIGVSMARSFRAEARSRETEATRLTLRAAQLESQLAEARLHALQSQLNPHFLFNALNTISAFTESDPKVARKAMASLGKLLRASLDHAGRAEVPVASELAFLEDYLTIERLRFEDRLTVEVSTDEDTRRALVPCFILQPLVENAIRHGVGALRRPCRIEVSIRPAGTQLLIRVDDDGAGLPEGWRLEDHAGIGLSNIERRLKELYGSEQTFKVSRRPEGGVRVEVTLPSNRPEAL